MANILANSTFSNFDIDSTSTIFDYDITLSANEWVGESSPYTYDLEFKDHKNMIDKIGINLGNNATNEQIAELQSANIMTANWVNNTTLRLIAYGENPPTLDIPIKLSIISVAIKFADDSSMLVFKDMVVSKSSWKSDSTYATEGFGYSADIVCPNVTEEYMPEVTFNVTDAACGNFSSNAATFEGIVRIYAREIPNENITVPTIICTIAAARLIGGSHAETHAKDGVDPITPEMIGALSLTGGTINGNLLIKKSLPSLWLFSTDHNISSVLQTYSDKGVALWTVNNADGDYTNRHGLVLQHQRDNLEMKQILSLVDTVDGVDYTYRIYGEHNPPYTYGTEDLVAGESPLETGKVYFVYE